MKKEDWIKGSLTLFIAALLYKAFGGPIPEIPFFGQSVSGLFGIGLSIGTILIAIGLLLILIPEPTTTIAGIIIAITGIALSGGAVFGFINSLVNGSPILFMAGVLLIGFFLVNNIMRR